MRDCNQDGITGNGFCSLNSLKYLDITSCNRETRVKAKKIFGVHINNQTVQQFIL